MRTLPPLSNRPLCGRSGADGAQCAIRDEGRKSGRGIYDGNEER